MAQHVGICTEDDNVVIRTKPNVGIPGAPAMPQSVQPSAPVAPSVGGGDLAQAPVIRANGLPLGAAEPRAAEVLLPRVPNVRGAPWRQDAELEGLRALVHQAEQDPGLAAQAATQLLQAAQHRLEARGVAVKACVLAEGHAGLQIQPNPDTDLGALAHFLDAQVDGFKLIYSPAKLFADHTRGAVWGLHRQVAAAHDLVFEGQPDPITLHEVEHAVLNYAEEQGARHRWLGFMQSIDGSPLSTVDEAQGGYLTYCSIQEIPAYAAQIRALARRLQACPEPGRDLTELQAMTRWGSSLAGRLADVAQRSLQTLEQTPEHMIFEGRKLVPEGRDAAQTPQVLWLSVERPELRLSIPLVEPALARAHEVMMGAQGEAWHEARAPLLAAARRELTDLQARAAGARESFDQVQKAVSKADSPSTIRAAARLALKNAGL